MLVRLSRAAFWRVEGWVNPDFGSSNPFYHLGSLGFYFFYIMVISGLYLIIYYEPTVTGSYDQLEYLTREQWYLGGIMRSLHRYSADGMVLVMGLHILRELVMGRFRGARWFSWVTGIPVLIMVYIAVIEGSHNSWLCVLPSGWTGCLFSVLRWRVISSPAPISPICFFVC